MEKMNKNTKNPNKIIKFILLVWLAAMVIWLVVGFARGFEAAKLYDQKEISLSDMNTENYMLWGSQETSEGMKTIETRVLMLSGPEYIGTIQLDEYQGADVACSSGKAKIFISDKNGNHTFYNSVTELYYEPGPAGEYDVWVVGKWFSGNVRVEY